MSHELRTPLNAMIGYSGDGIAGSIDDTARRMIGGIHDSSSKRLHLIDDILDLSKIEAGRLTIVEEPYNPRELIETIADQMRILSDQKRLAFVTEVAPDVPTALVGDSTRLEQIIVNLLSNAFKFTPCHETSSAG